MNKRLKGFINVGVLVGLIVAIIVFGSLIGTVADYTSGVNASSTNITGATHTIAGLVPLFLTIFIMMGVIGYIKSR